MRKNRGLSSGSAWPFDDRRWLLPFLATLLVTATLLLGNGTRSIEAAIRDRLLGGDFAAADDQGRGSAIQVVSASGRQRHAEI